MRRIPYTQLDVFTSQPFGGNQLAVFFDAEALDSREMQLIAREMNFSESTFVLPPTDPSVALWRVRIFTPSVELPFAGHPVIGTTVALVHAGRLRAEDVPATLELAIGPLVVEPALAGGEAHFVVMTQPLPTFAPWEGDREALLAALGLDTSALRAGLPIERGSAGVPFIYVPLRDEAAIQRAKPGAGLAAALGEDSRVGVYLFATTNSSRRSQPVHARMFAPGLGVTEDAATGSAAGPLGAYLVRHGLLAPDTDGKSALGVLQGAEIGRYSSINVFVQSSEGVVTGVRVGGRSVIVATGEFILPDTTTTAGGRSEG
jgi:trans-2,3-dihydro-3-hydroxyanthranilate isomerase